MKPYCLLFSFSYLYFQAHKFEVLSVLQSVLSSLRKVVADPDVAIDLGTANTRLYACGRGIVDVPSSIKISNRKDSNETSNKEGVISKVDSLPKSILPLQAGVIKDVDAATYLLTPLLQKVRRLGLIKPHVLACAPTDATKEERQALVEATLRAGAAKVIIEPEPLAAAIGAGLDISSDYAQMLVDIGDGVTDIAVIRSNSLITAAATRIACSDIHTAIQNMVLKQYSLSLSLSEAEQLTKKIGVLPVTSSNSIQKISAINPITNQQVVAQIKTEDINQAILPVINKIVTTICAVIRDLPPMTSCEVIENGICLTGGGTCLPGIQEFIAEKTLLDIKPATNPMHAVINGARQMLNLRMTTGFWTT
jgi:rod shape-determining protein MreB